MGLAREVEKIRDNPGEYLTEACVLALGAFLHGFHMANSGCTSMLRDLDRRFQGPSAADACTRAYLSFTTSERALRAVLDALSSLIAEKGDPENHVWEGVPREFMEVVREPIVSGRTGMVFGEPTVMWCANTWKGFLAGLAATDARTAAQQVAQFEAFERWLGQYHGHERAPWYAMVRVYGGADIRGLRELVTLWEEFRRCGAGSEYQLVESEPVQSLPTQS